MINNRHYSLARMVEAVDINRHVCSFAGVEGRISGNIILLRGMKNIVILLHAPFGCGFHAMLVPRLKVPFTALRCSDMDEKDIIMGGEDALAASVERIIEEERPEIIAIIPGAVSEMISSDIAEVARRYKDDARCSVVFIEPRCFSHRDRRVHRDEKGNEIEKDYALSDIYGSDEPPGCGSNEAICSLIKQLTEPSETNKTLVNTLGLSGNWVNNGFGESVVETFSEAGVNFNIMNSAESFKRAASAPLNFAAESRWTKMMYKHYGTDYFSVEDTFYAGLCSIRGIADMYRAIAERLGKTEAITRLIELKQAEIKEKLEAVKSEYRRFEYAAVSGNWNVKGNLEALRDDFGIVPKYYIINIDEEWMRTTGRSDDEIEEEFIEFYNAISEADYHGKVILIRDREGVIKCLENVDFVINGRLLLMEYPAEPTVRQMKFISSPLQYSRSFEERIDSMEASLFLLRNASPSSESLAQKLENFRELHPEIGERSNPALKWWRKMWFNESP